LWSCPCGKKTPINNRSLLMTQTISLICEEGPKPRAKSFLTRELFAPKPSPEATARYGKVWTISLDFREFSLVDEAGQVVVVYPREEAEALIRVPAKHLDLEEVVNLGISDGDGDYFWFRPERDAMRLIKRYLNQTVLLQGDQAYDEMCGAAWGSFVCGLLAAPISIALAFGIAWGIQLFFKQFGVGVVAISGGIVIAGFGCLSNGIRDLLRFRELSRYRKEILDGAVVRGQQT
jgi:hypothetical protein